MEAFFSVGKLSKQITWHEIMFVCVCIGAVD